MGLFSSLSSHIPSLADAQKEIKTLGDMVEPTPTPPIDAVPLKPVKPDAAVPVEKDPNDGGILGKLGSTLLDSAKDGVGSLLSQTAGDLTHVGVDVEVSPISIDKYTILYAGLAIFVVAEALRRF